MKRGLFAGLLVACCLSLVSLLSAPRSASAALKVGCDCDAQLARCVDGAIANYDACICNLNDPNLPACLITFAAPVTGSSATSVSECVEELQGGLFKCTLENAACNLVCGSDGGRPRR